MMSFLSNHPTSARKFPLGVICVKIVEENVDLALIPLFNTHYFSFKLLLALLHI